MSLSAFPLHISLLGKRYTQIFVNREGRRKVELSFIRLFWDQISGGKSIKTKAE